jgi:hypothetical protein
MLGRWPGGGIIGGAPGGSGAPAAAAELAATFKMEPREISGRGGATGGDMADGGGGPGGGGATNPPAPADTDRRGPAGGAPLVPFASHEFAGEWVGPAEAGADPAPAPAKGSPKLPLPILNDESDGGGAPNAIDCL